MKHLKTMRLLALLLAVLMLCTSCKEFNVFSGAAGQKAGDWDSYVADFFADAFGDDGLSLHYYVEHPENYGIEEVKDSYGTLYEEEIDDEDFYYATNAIEEIKAFDDKSLTEQQRKDKETLLWYLETQKMAEDKKFLYYEEYAAPMYGVQSNLPINLANYTFVEEKDVTHYLALLDDTGRYLDELFQYEKKRAELNYGMNDELIDQVINECEEFLGSSLEENVLITTFDERIDALGVDAAKAEEYKATNRKKVEEQVFPAYQTFMTNMESLKGVSKGTGCLADMEYGKEYYEYLARGASSSDRSVEELKQLLKDSINDQYGELYQMMAEDPDILDKMEDPNYGASDPVDILELIASRMGDVLVPDIGDAKYTVRYVPKSLETSSNPAFCFIPQIDNIESAIYINQSPEYAHMDFFITVAHEGYPGHMYQNTYYYNTNPAPFRHIIDFSGYTEGWAVYISYEAVKLSDIKDENLCRILALNEAIGYEMSGLADIGVNYEGWSLEELGEFFSGYGMDEAALKDLYNQLISTPAVYLSYSAAACEFWELRDYAKEKMGDKYNDVDFHRIILNEGPTAFSILKERVDAAAK